MNISSISLSYFLLGFGIISIGFFFYFKLLVTKTSEENPHKEDIMGNMKDPHSWRERNSKMSYISLFWAIVSLGGFVYFKFFYTMGLIPLMYLFIYIAVAVISIFIFSRVKHKAI